MKTVLKKSLFIFLAVAILASSTGVTVFKMVCGRSGKEIVSLVQINNCCKNKSHEKERIEKRCCDFSTQVFKVNLLHKTEFKVVPFHCFATLIYSVLHQTKIDNRIILPVSTNISPPQSGRQILCSISTFLI